MPRGRPRKNPTTVAVRKTTPTATKHMLIDEVWQLGNRRLRPDRISGWEFTYKSDLSNEITQIGVKGVGLVDMEPLTGREITDFLRLSGDKPRTMPDKDAAADTSDDGPTDDPQNPEFF